MNKSRFVGFLSIPGVQNKHTVSFIEPRGIRNQNDTVDNRSIYELK